MIRNSSKRGASYLFGIPVHPLLREMIIVVPHQALHYLVMCSIVGNIFPSMRGIWCTKSECVYPRTLTLGAKFFLSVTTVQVLVILEYIRPMHYLEYNYTSLDCIRTSTIMCYSARGASSIKRNALRLVVFYIPSRFLRASGKAYRWIS